MILKRYPEGTLEDTPETLKDTSKQTSRDTLSDIAGGPWSDILVGLRWKAFQTWDALWPTETGLIFTILLKDNMSS